MQIHEAFDTVLKKYRITGKTLAQVSGVSPSHISQFRNGKGGGISHKTLEELLGVLEDLAPGSRFSFCLLLAGKDPEQQDLETLISSMSDKELKTLLLLVAEKLVGSEVEIRAA